jgi:hypothetical protein
VQNKKSTPPSTPLLIFCLILLTLGLRVVQLKADPPADFSWSGGYFADEGYWSHNARNEVLFGNPVMDEWDARVVSPLFAFLQRWIFQIFGVGLAQVRLIGLLSAVLIVLSSFFILRKQMESGTAFFCSVLVSLNYPMLVLARQGILDPFAAALAWGALLLILSQSSIAAFAGGVLFVGACITKYLMIYAFVPLALALFVVMKPARTQILLFFFGVVLAGTIWLVSNYIPNRELLTGYSQYYSSQQSWQWKQVVANIITQPFYLYMIKTPAILFFGNLMVWFLFLPRWKAGKMERLFWIWLVSGILFFALWKYRPFRYYTSLIPPLAVLAGIALLRIQDLTIELRIGKVRWWILLGMLIPFSQILLLLMDRWMNAGFFPEQLGIHAIDAIAFLLLSVFAVWVYLRAQEKGKWMWLAFFLVFLAGDMRSYLSWMLNPQYAALNISQDLQMEVNKGAVTGQWAPELCLENDVRAVPVWYGFVNSEKPFQTYGITHLLLWRYPLGDETKLFQKWYPADFPRFHIVKSYFIKDTELVLYERMDERPKQPARSAP